MNKYSLEQLALFDLCLFCDDFVKSMETVGGYDSEEAFALRMDLRCKVHRGEPLNVVNLYHTYRNSSAFVEALERVLQDFFNNRKIG